MTDETTQALLPVTQADRDAAAAMYAFYYSWTDTHKNGTAQRIRRGEYDPLGLVQSYARHRLAHSLPSQADETGGDVERLVRAANAVLAAMDVYNAENGTYLGGPAFFELGCAIAALTKGAK